MSREIVHNVRGPVYLAEYSHKHGSDFSVHTTYEGAQEYLKTIVADFKDDFIPGFGNESYKDSGLDELVERWTDITGSTEWLNITELELQK